MSIIRIEKLTKRYGEGENAVYALSDINISFEKGEAVAITGASGSGKTTLLNMLGGLDFPDNGKVFYENTDIFSLNDSKLSELRLKKIGFVFQFFNLLPELTAYENIITPVIIDGKKPDKKKISEVADMLGITDRLSHLPSHMSGGQQQRTAIARAIINNPEVILCDEPTGNLDEKSGNEVLSYLIKINRELGKTLIIVTHDMRIAEKCRRIIKIADGKIVSDTRKD